MKKSKRVLAGAGLIMSLSVLTSCSQVQPMSFVYGPPQDMNNIRIPKPEPAVTASAAPTEEPDFPVAVYGPPEWFEQDPVDPEWPEDVYGPPEWFEEPADEEVEWTNDW